MKMSRIQCAEEFSKFSLQAFQSSEKDVQDDETQMVQESVLALSLKSASSDFVVSKALRLDNHTEEALKFRNAPNGNDRDAFRFKIAASRVYDASRSQTAETVRNLSAKWDRKILFGKINSWELLEKLSLTIDASDNVLGSTSQYIHVLQVFEAMVADDVTDKRLLFLGLAHDIGKVLSLFGESDGNVDCSTFVIKPGVAGKGVNSSIVSWNHDEFGYQKLKDYLSQEMAWVVRYHSLYPLLVGGLDELLLPEEHEWKKLLQKLWEYDHLFKNSKHIPVVDAEYAKSIWHEYLPKEIMF